MQPIFPDQKDLINYIVAVHQNERIHITYADAQKTLKKEGVPNPYIAGHFRAINYAMELARSYDWPCRNPELIKNDYQTNVALFWLKELHTKMILELSKDPTSGIRKYQVGTWREIPMQMAFGPAPDPKIILPTLRVWATKTAELDHEILPNIDNPSLITRDQSNRIYEIIDSTPHTFAFLQPFEVGSSRIGFLLENILRARWHLPWITRIGPEYDKYVAELGAMNELPEIFTTVN